MKYLAYLAMLTLHSSVLAENCDKLGILLYEELACEPKTHKNDCPSSYECKSLTVPGKCVVHGKIYNPGDRIADNTESYSCPFGCFCVKSNDGLMSVRCAQSGCAEWAASAPPGCYRKYSLDSCCSTGQTCGTPINGTKCIVDGKEYNEDERFYPKDSCYVCVCQKGFSGKYVAPYCKRSGCDFQIRNQQKIQDGCAPLYLKRSGDSDTKCCTSSWICPDGNEEIKKGDTDTDLTCKFGTKILKVGDHFIKQTQYNRRDLKIKCECQIPPMISCEEAK